MMKLKHNPSFPVPEFCRAACVEVGIARPVQPNVAAGRAVEGAEQVQQGALPASDARRSRRTRRAALRRRRPQDLEHLSIAAREHAPDRLGRQERVHRTGSRSPALAERPARWDTTAPGCDHDARRDNRQRVE